MKDLNRIKVVLVEKKRTAKWLAEELGKNSATVSKWCTTIRLWACSYAQSMARDGGISYPIHRPPIVCRPIRVTVTKQREDSEILDAREWERKSLMI